MFPSLALGRVMDSSSRRCSCCSNFIRALDLDFDTTAMTEKNSVHPKISRFRGDLRGCDGLVLCFQYCSDDPEYMVEFCAFLRFWL